MGYLDRSMLHVTVVVILKREKQTSERAQKECCQETRVHFFWRAAPRQLFFLRLLWGPVAWSLQTSIPEVFWAQQHSSYAVKTRSRLEEAGTLAAQRQNIYNMTEQTHSPVR